MADYNSQKMNLIGQGLDNSTTSARRWLYSDTGPVADVIASGFVTDAKDKGMKVGDFVEYYDSSRTIHYGLTVSEVQDTGGTTGTLDGQVIVADTS